MVHRNYLFLFLGITTLGLIAFSPAIYAAIEPHIAITMDPGQTTDPFQIKDDSNNDVFVITPQGSISPTPVTTTTVTFDDAYITELNPVVHSSSPATIITQTAESGAGVYQFTYTITASDLDPVDSVYGLWLKDQFVPHIYAQFENTGIGSISANWSIWFNDVELYQATDSTVSSGDFVRAGWAEGGNYFDGIAGYNFLQVGDEIGIKMWTNTSGDLRLNHIGIIVVPRITFTGISFYIDDQHAENSPAELSPTFPFSPTAIQGTGGCYNIGMWDTFDGVLVGDHWTGVTGAKYYYSNFLNAIQSLSSDNMYWLDNACLFNTPNTFTYTVWK